MLRFLRDQSVRNEYDLLIFSLFIQRSGTELFGCSNLPEKSAQLADITVNEA